MTAQPFRHRPFLLAIATALLLCAPLAARSASVTARHGAVAAEHKLASEAGVEILKEGGNAIDAAVAAALATGVVNPSSSGIGGGGFLVWWDQAHKSSSTVDFRETAPSSASQTMYELPDGTLDSKASKNGPRAVAVPGELRGFALALKRYGKKSFCEVASPAIRLARDGFAIEAHLASMIASGRDRLAANAELARVFLHEDGSPRREGETLQRPQLAATLERLCKVGVEDFYRGEIAADILRTVPPISAEDLANYRPLERAPIRIQYRGRTVLSMAPPSSGGGMLAEILAVLSGYNPAKLRSQGAAWPHLLGETMKAAFADRAVYYGDPAFTTVPIARLTSAEHTAQIRARLRAKQAVPAAEFAPPTNAGNDAGTTNISVIDARGNAVALTTSVNTGFGAGLSVPGRDILLNNTMDDFSAQPGKPNHFGLVGSRANAIAPGKRPLSSMTPTVLLQRDKAVMAVGGSGGPLIITATLQTLLGAIDFGLSVEDAVSAPRIHHQWMPDVLNVEKAVPAETTEVLRSYGHKVTPLTSKVSVTAVGVSGEDDARTLNATSDPRKGGVPAGY